MSNDKPPFDFETTLVKDHSVIAGVNRDAVPPRLELARGPGAPRTLALGPDETVVGRSHQANICIESSLLSRRHISIRRSGPEFRLNDLESANGVFLNGVRVHSAGLHEGDTIQIGDVVFVFREGVG
ncbi:MAG: FHA domain-containing protein [Hyphomonadaceae bacterium]